MSTLLNWVFVLLMSYLSIAVMGFMAKVFYLVFMTGWNVL